MPSIKEVVDWSTTSNENQAHHPTGPQGREASRTSSSFQELQAAIARWRDSLGGGSPLTTKGDLYTYSTIEARLPVGTNGQILSANAGQATGLEWIDVPASSAAGANNEIQFNNSGVLGADPFLSVDLTSAQTPKLILDGTSGNYRYPTIEMNYDANDYAAFDIYEEGVVKAYLRYYASFGGTDQLLFENMALGTSDTTGIISFATRTSGGSRQTRFQINRNGPQILQGGLELKAAPTVPHTDRTSYGQIFLRSSDNLLIFRNSAGTEYDLTGTVPPSSTVVSGASPYFGWIETDATLDQGYWRATADGEALSFSIWDDAETNSYAWAQIDRSGTGASVQVDTINFQAATSITLGNYVFNVNQTVGAGQDNYVLTYDNSSGEIGLEAAGGAGIGGSIADNQVAVGAATADEIEGTAQLTFDSTASLPALTVNSDVTGSPSIRFDQNAVNKAIIRWQHTGTYLNINSDNDIQLRAGNTTALTLDSATQDGTFSAGLTVTDKLQTAASGLAEAGLNIPEGVAPSGPLDGDVWVTAAGEFFARLNGVSVDLAAGGGVSVSGTPVNNELAVWTDASTIEGEPSLTFNNANDRLTVGAGAAGAASPQIDINAQLTGVPTISWNQAGVAKAFISYVDADDMFAIGADNEIELRPSNVGDWGILSTTSAKFGNYTFNTDQTVGAGQDNFVLTYDNGTGEISLEAAAGGGIGGSITDNQIAVGAATANEIEGSALLTYDGTYLKMDDVAPFGMMFTNTSSGTNAKKFSIGNLLGIAGIRFWNDAETANTELITWQRSGTNVTTVDHQGNKFRFFPDSSDQGFEITHNILTLGNTLSSAATGIRNPLSSHSMKISGGSNNFGSSLQLFGSSHANANDIILGHGTNVTVWDYDYSTGTSTFWSGSGTTAQALQIDTNGIVTFFNKAIFDASTTANPSINIPEGVAPTAPADGDVWVTAAGEFFARLNGVSVDLAAGVGDVVKVGTPVNNQLGVWTGDGTIEGDANLTWDGTTLTLGNGQLKFPATQNASADANTLDDYEEGTWSPVLSDGTNNATMDGTLNVGWYVKVGRLVTFGGYVSTTSLGSVSGALRITGLPFTVATANGANGGVSVGYAAGLAITAGQVVGFSPVYGTTYMDVRLWDTTGGTGSMQSTEWTADGRAGFCGSYIV